MENLQRNNEPTNCTCKVITIYSTITLFIISCVYALTYYAKLKYYG